MHRKKIVFTYYTSLFVVVKRGHYTVKHCDLLSDNTRMSNPKSNDEYWVARLDYIISKNVSH